MSKSFDCFGIQDFSVYENSYTRDGARYAVKDLIELAKKEEPFNLQIIGIDIGVNPWGDRTIKNFCYHVRRMNAAELEYPVILDDTGFVCDGWHRIAKAIINGQTTVKAVRLKIMPEPISKD